MLNVTIDKDVERPKIRRRIGSQAQKYPFWAQMEVGDSIFFKAEDVRPATILNAATRYRKRNPGWRYSSRTEPNGVRIWREDDAPPEESTQSQGQTADGAAAQ